MTSHTQTSAPKAVVVGAGIIGLTTALRLAETGYDVTVIEREAEPCNGSSKANAGQLLYDRIGAMGSAGFLRGLPGTLLNPDQGVSALGLANPVRWPWTASFLRQCTMKAWQVNTRGLLEIAARSRGAMADIQARYDLAFDWRKSGKLLVHPTGEALRAADRSAQFQAQFGGRHEVLNRAACLQHEPALRHTSRSIAGGIYLPDAEVGDCRKFGQNIAAILIEKFGAQIAYDQRVLEIIQTNGRATALCTDQGLIKADLFVLATGKSVCDLLPGGSAIKKHLVGVKGVTLTYPVGQTPPDLSVTDASGKFVVMRLGDRVRVAGYAIFSDGDDIKPGYADRLATKARALMPEAAEYDAAPEIWVGIRPQTPDDLPMIGPTGTAGLYVNAGHGSLGWTLALGSAEELMEKISRAAQCP